MVCVKVDRGKDSTVFVDFRQFPLTDPRDFRSRPEGAVSFAEASVIAGELAAGAIQGWLGIYRWYRQACSTADW
jgi:hypothetical protein